ncbi:MAG: hypothetical protein DME50_11445 [Verrucomicrobia bacterium]|nr:MAG: hypothetical protein DME50_11445 [Verrucomicrobiota bacterium]
MFPSLNKPSSDIRERRKKSKMEAPASIRVVEAEDASGFAATLVTEADLNLKVKAAMDAPFKTFAPPAAVR